MDAIDSRRLMKANSCPDYEKRSITAQTVSGNNRSRYSNQKPALQFSNKSCQTDTDNLNTSNEFLKMHDQWSHFSHKGYSVIEGYSENKGLLYRGLSVEIKSHSKSKFVFDGQAALLESIKFATDAPLQERDTCILFIWKNDLYSSSVIRKIMIENKTDGDSFDIILFSEREGQLRIEILSDVIIDTAFQVAKILQNLKDGRHIRKLKDVLILLESGDQGKQITDLLKPRNTQQKRKSNTERSKSMKAVTIDKKYRLSKFPGRYHEIHDKEIEKETQEKENESTTDLSPVMFAKPGDSEVWKFMNERRKIPNTCKGKQTSRHRLDQEINWDELVQGISVPDIDRTEDDQENGCFGSNLDKIKTAVIKPEQELDKTVNDFHTIKTEKKKLCKLCQERELDTIFLPCGHLVLCNFCCASQNIKLCPQCYKEIEHVNEAHF